jgi:hypothetical protein
MGRYAANTRPAGASKGIRGSPEHAVLGMVRRITRYCCHGHQNRLDDADVEDEGGHHLPAGIYGFSGGKKTSSFIFVQNIARVKIVL